MADCPHFHVKKRTLLGIAGTVWLAAGINVARLGILAYRELRPIPPLAALGSLAVFLVFGQMFLRMSVRHHRRIRGCPRPTQPFWHFFDLRSYCIMAVMMSGGIALRASGLLPVPAIAVFYTGLGCALALAGLSFWRMFLLYARISRAEADGAPSAH